MTTIKALADGAEKELELLGELHAIQGAPAAELTIQKPVSIPGAGFYWKAFTAPLYSRRVMEEGAKRSEEPWDLSAAGCLGMLTRKSRKGRSPAGYVRRQMGLYDLCLPVYSVAGASCFFWKVVGYLPAGKGYVAVTKRRVGYWVWLALAALVAFGASYLLFRYDIRTLANTLQDLPGLLSAKWFKTLREWGIL